MSDARLQRVAEAAGLRLHTAEGGCPRLHPTSTEDLARCLAAAEQEGVRLRTRAGLPDPLAPERAYPSWPAEPDELRLSLDGLQGLDVDQVSGVVHAGAGWTGAALEHALRDLGYTLGVLPEELRRLPVGCYVASGYAAARSVTHSSQLELVTGLEVVLPDGRTTASGHSPRAAVGPDLRGYVIGGRDQLGVISRVSLPIRPVQAHAALIVGFPRFTFGLLAARALAVEGLAPAAGHLVSASSPERFFDVAGDRAKPLQGGMLGLVWTGDEAVVTACVAAARDIVGRHRGVVVEDPGPAEALVDAVYSGPAARGAEGVVDGLQRGARWEIGRLAVAAPWRRLELLVTGITSTTGGATRAFAHVNEMGPCGALARFSFQSRSTPVPGHLFFHGLLQTIQVNGGIIAGSSFRDVSQPPEGSFAGRGSRRTSADPARALGDAIRAELAPHQSLNPRAFDGPLS